MRSISPWFLVALHVAVLWSEASTKPVDKKDDKKELIMLELEPLSQDRLKRSHEDSAERFVRQGGELPPDYLNLLQQLSAQQQSAPPQRPQLVNQLLVARDGSKQPAAARYVLSQDGRVLQESLGLQAVQSTPPPGRPAISPELEAFSRAQTQLQQDYHDAPIRAQIAGLTERPDPFLDSLRASPPPSGPESPSPQIFSQAAAQAFAQQQLRTRAQLDTNPDYAAQFQQQQPQPEIDPSAYFQQQIAQLTVASQATGRQLIGLPPQPQRSFPQPKQSQPQLFAQYQPQIPSPKRPIGPSAYAQFVPPQQSRPLPQPQGPPQPQPTPEDLPQQYLIETSRAASPSQLVRFAQPQPDPQLQSSYALQRQQEEYLTSLFSPSAGRGLFSPASAEKPSQSSIYVTRAGARPSGPTTATPVEEREREKLPVVRIPSPANQRALTRSDLDALIEAGYSITPVDREGPPQIPQPQPSAFKNKRMPSLSSGRNHVVYHNLQDGVQYEYSPGSSDYVSAKAKRESDS